MTTASSRKKQARFIEPVLCPALACLCENKGNNGNNPLFMKKILRKKQDLQII
jgi:hypothetical protein